jgi:hypothetical protein
MRRLIRKGSWSLCVVVVAIALLSSLALAGQVAEFGDSGFLDIDYQLQLRDAWRDTGGGVTGKDDTTNLYFRRNRLSFLGMANQTFGGAIQVEYNGLRSINDLDVSQEASPMQVTLLDAYLTAYGSDALQFRAGKTKQVMTREIQEGCYDPLSVDRSSFILGPFTKNSWSYNKTTRDNGIAVLGNLFNDVFQYRLAVMQGNKYTGSGAPDSAGYRYTGRVHVTLLDPESGWGYRGSYLGKKQVLTLGAGYEMEPKAVYADVNQTGTEDYTAYTVDAFYEQPTNAGTFTLSGAYLKTDFGKAGTRGVTGATGIFGEKNGGYWKGAYMLGKVQVYGRYEKWSFADLEDVVGQTVTYTAEGVNYYINGQNLRLTLEYGNTDKEKPVPGTNVRSFKTVIAQFQVRF